MKLFRSALLLASLAAVCGAGSCLDDCHRLYQDCRRTCGSGVNADTACVLACRAAYVQCAGACPAAGSRPQ